MAVPDSPSKAASPATTKHTVKAGYISPHPSLRRESLDVVGFIQQPDCDVYTADYLASLTPVHQMPRKWFERIAWWWLLAVRTFVGLLTGTFGRVGAGLSERQLAHRAQMLNCDGQATAMSVWSELLPPSLPDRIFRLMLTANLLFQCCVVYALAPSVIHAYQVYRAEEDLWWLALTLKLLSMPGRLPAWERATAPAAAQAYYALPPTASLKDVVFRMMADEVSIRHINHQLAGLTPGTRTPAVATRQFGS